MKSEWHKAQTLVHVHLPQTCKPCVQGILHFTDEESRGTSILLFKVRQQINCRAEILLEAALTPNGGSYSRHF